MSAPTHARRRARGEVPALILRHLDAHPTERYTPYGLAHELGMSSASTTAAVKRMVDKGEVHCYGHSPLIVGRLRS